MRYPSVIRHHELAFRTQYAEVKERVQAAGLLLPGTPGSLAIRTVRGREYWYRVYYPVPKKVSEAYVCATGDESERRAMEDRIQFGRWVATQVRSLRRLGFQVGSKQVARVLVELHNRGITRELVLVGTQAYMALLNELGAVSISAMTMDVDLGAEEAQSVRIVAGASLLQTLKDTQMPFVPVPGLNPKEGSATAKLPGADGLRVDLLTAGPVLGTLVPVPALQWSAQTIPYFDYLLADPEQSAVLAGDHCIPVRVPQPARFVWHKLYSSRHRQEFPEKAVKDRQQAATLAQVLHEDDPEVLDEAWRCAPVAMREDLLSWMPASLRGTERTLFGNALKTARSRLR